MPRDVQRARVNHIQVVRASTPLAAIRCAAVIAPSSRTLATRRRAREPMSHRRQRCRPTTPPRHRRTSSASSLERAIEALGPPRDWATGVRPTTPGRPHGEIASPHPAGRTSSTRRGGPPRQTPGTAPPNLRFPSSSSLLALLVCARSLFRFPSFAPPPLSVVASLLRCSPFLVSVLVVC